MDQSALPACSGGGGHVRVPPGERIARPAPCCRAGRTLTSAVTESAKRSPDIVEHGGGVAYTCADVRVPTSKCEPLDLHTDAGLSGLGMRARVLAARHDALATRVVGAMRTRPRAVLSAHSARTSTSVGRAEAYSRRQQNVKRYHRTVAGWWSSSSPLERDRHVHVSPAKHRTPGPRHASTVHPGRGTGCTAVA